MEPKFKVDDRVYFDLNGAEEYSGWGTVLGLIDDYISNTYIVFLEKPISGRKAILVQESLMRHMNWPTKIEGK